MCTVPLHPLPLHRQYWWYRFYTITIPIVIQQYIVVVWSNGGFIYVPFKKNFKMFMNTECDMSEAVYVHNCIADTFQLLLKYFEQLLWPATVKFITPLSIEINKWCCTTAHIDYGGQGVTWCKPHCSLIQFISTRL